MSAKGEKKLRREVRKLVTENIAVQASKDPDGLAARCQQLERICRDLKSREGRIVVGLTAIAIAYKKQDHLVVNRFIGDMLRDVDLLAKCNKAMAERDLAMKIAIEAIKKAMEGSNLIRIGADLGKGCREALVQIAMLDPFFLYSHSDDVPIETPQEAVRT